MNEFLTAMLFNSFIREEENVTTNAISLVVDNNIDNYENL